MSELVAAIDIGTNSTRLLIGDGERAVERRTTTTRLGAGVDATRRLAPEAIDRTVAALAEYRELLDRHGVTTARAIATSAARDATNAQDFFGPAEAALGFRPELLTGLEEGRLAFRGATLGMDPTDGPFLVVDIGGGSTEFIVGTGEVDGSISVDVGSVRLTEAHLVSDPPLPEELSNAISVVEAHIDDVMREVPAVKGYRRMVGVAGTITTVAAVEIGLQVYDRERLHRFVLTKTAAEDVFRTLATESVEDRKHNPGLNPNRADIIVGGCCVLVAVMRAFGAEELVVSETDILDGVVLDLLGR
jgi:exopolyphosphatase / guanosine-5'-triphosphate,3'-diphosphate pyrophosphatase